MISVVMAHYNRINLLRHTLKTICNTKSKDFEIIIVDDFSDTQHNLSSIKSEFPQLKINLINMSDVVATKTYVSPCVPYNVGFRASRGDKIIIQNPECCHVGDVISYAENNLNDNNYLSYHCWSCDRPDLNLLHTGRSIQIDKPQPTKAKWYNHKDHRPVAFHFASAITRKNLIELNGFDERYALGFNYDDTEFLQRIKNKNLKIDFVADPFVIHQYHGKMFNNPLNPQATVNTKELFEDLINNPFVRANNKDTIQ
jgi:glycosyltransferase involved in cell wall biosynthesis